MILVILIAGFKSLQVTPLNSLELLGAMLQAYTSLGEVSDS